MQHHQDSIDVFVERASQDPEVIGIVLDGSVAAGTERPDSDVDLCLVLTPEAFATAWKRHRLSYVERDGITYPGGYYDIKVASSDYLRRAAECGDEPMRASLLHARVLWSRDDELAGLIAAVPLLPDHVWEQRMASFIAQLRLHGGYFLRQAAEHHNSYLSHHAAVHMVGAGGRALLALNRTLFQGQKYLDQTLAGLDRIPVGYAEAARAALDDPGIATGTRYRDLLESFHAWPLTEDETLSTFVRDNELGWFTGRAPAEYA
ncbi:nucleotidyltransferase domain-containing protein [Microlunatus soli]|uniref:Nucleotidyltransferase domain-containing protein n=1 Tax=Microlunatus soli TaxID=630515 RepID=A0A1H1RXN7_9ACTN|nr:nucleotidyltransferase domain-containing protein [Microlunatus soli]SDS40464.1 Nucleotidyltransferase domain-containing protein [Microlunatus soli]